MIIQIEIEISQEPGRHVTFVDIYNAIFDIENKPLYLTGEREVELKITKVHQRLIKKMPNTTERHYSLKAIQKAVDALIREEDYMPEHAQKRIVTLLECL